MRGTFLKNTEFIYGAVVYTGHNTKIMKNSSQSKMKTSRNERMLNKQIMFIFIIQILTCLFSAIYGTIWEQRNKDKSYIYLNINLTHKKVWVNYFIWTVERFGSWLLMFTYLIPISLIVTVELVRLGQASFITYDSEIYDVEKDLPTTVQSSNLNEELG